MKAQYSVQSKQMNFAVKIKMFNIGDTDISCECHMTARTENFDLNFYFLCKNDKCPTC